MVIRIDLLLDRPTKYDDGAAGKSCSNIVAKKASGRERKAERVQYIGAKVLT